MWVAWDDGPVNIQKHALLNHQLLVIPPFNPHEVDGEISMPLLQLPKSESRSSWSSPKKKVQLVEVLNHQIAKILVNWLVTLW
jgi:hypothetical protein